MIKEFRGETRWLSNFSAVLINYNGGLYNSTESAFQAQKTLDLSERIKFENMKPAEAKTYGMKVKLRPDWDGIKLKIMYEVNLIKFQQEPFKTWLLNTIGQQLIEGNTWGDKYWGMVDGIGENHLGKILMRIRSELLEKSND